MSTLTASHSLTLSKTGLKLIKAYEGFRAEDRELINGQRVVGYGHKLKNDRPRRVSKAQAERLLMNDLRPFEDMVNENVHAPLTQGQFDALVSFAFNIGKDAFLESATLHALNNGRPLDAANSLDIWRKSTINGKTYVVDALMRRRTAEKALFLRTDSKPKPAPTLDLPPSEDAFVPVDLDAPVFKEPENAGLVAHVPIDKASDDVRSDFSGGLKTSETDVSYAADVKDLTEADVIDVDFTDEEDENGTSSSQDKVSAASDIANIGMTGFRNIDVTETVIVDVDDNEVDITDISGSDIADMAGDTLDKAPNEDPSAVITELFDTTPNQSVIDDSVANESTEEMSLQDSILEIIAPGNGQVETDDSASILVLNDSLIEPETETSSDTSLRTDSASDTPSTEGRSVIADAAADISERLDALIEGAKDEEVLVSDPASDALTAKFAQSLSEDSEDNNSQDLKEEEAEKDTAPEVLTLRDTIDVTETAPESAKPTTLSNPETRLDGPLVENLDIETLDNEVIPSEDAVSDSVTETEIADTPVVEAPVTDDGAVDLKPSYEEVSAEAIANENISEETILTDLVDTTELAGEETQAAAVGSFENNPAAGFSAKGVYSENGRMATRAQTRNVDTSPLQDTQPDIVIDNLAEDDAMRGLSDMPVFIGRTETPQEVKAEGKAGLWIIIILGLLILTFAGILHFMGSSAQFGEWGASVVLSGLVVGSVTVLAGLYYTARRAMKPKTNESS